MPIAEITDQKCISSLEKHFCRFRKNIIGIDQTFQSPYGKKKILYADWTASGRLYGPIEDIFRNNIFPFVGNTHTETNITGTGMTLAYHQARQIIKEHVNAGPDDVIISSSSGMTGVVNKFQRILGIRLHESFRENIVLPERLRPIIFVTHMEHHSNQTSWLETTGEVKLIEPGKDGLPDLVHLKKLLAEYADRKYKFAAITACSNVTGIQPAYYDIAELMHQNKGYCFVDFACSAPYDEIDMHPEPGGDRYLDAIYFSPHKFLGGPGAAGVLIFNKELYKNRIPDNPGGGTVDWTNPWGQHKFVEDIEAREDGGTPAFLQTIKTALCIRLKEHMGVENIHKREKEILDILFPALENIPGLHILDEKIKMRFGIISFFIDGLHYNLGVRMLNDRFGIQTRGGCSCAGTYGHILLNVDRETSKKITDGINQCDLSGKPGWIRLSIHPTMTNEEIFFIIDALENLAQNFHEWTADYHIDHSKNVIRHKNPGAETKFKEEINRWLNPAF